MAGRGERSHAELFVADYGLDGFRHTFDATADTWSEFDHFFVPGYVFINDDGTATNHVGALGHEQTMRRLTELAEN